MGNIPLRSRTVLFESLVEFAPDALLVVDANGRIVFANTMAETLFGFGADELLNLSIETLVPERFRQIHGRHRRTYAGEPRTREMGASMAELVATRRDGVEFPVEIRLSPIDVAGELLIAAAVRDVTERRHAAQTVRAAREEAERANVTKGRFLAAASHDLRQPLQTLQLLNGALETRTADPESREFLGGQREALDGMSRLLNALLDISKLEAGNIKPIMAEVSVVELFGELRREFESVAAARGLELTVEASPHYIRTDRTLFRQLLENLLSNALKYTGAGSIGLICKPEAEDLLIAVTDTGIGIGPEQLASIFEEFYQIDRGPRRQGVGLGLAIVKRLAALLDVSIKVQSKPGHGSQFLVGVPARQIVDWVPVKKVRPASFDRALSSPGALILLVEDDTAVRNATTFYLKAVGHTMITADSIAEAERILQTSERAPDLIITDYHLGAQETGVDLIQRVRSRVGKALPALLLSGDTSTAIHNLTDIDRVLNKPVDAAILNDTITQMLSRHSAN